MNNLQERANKMISFLSLQDAIELKGRAYCSLSAMILKMTLGNIETSREAEERLEKELDKLDKAFEKAVAE